MAITLSTYIYPISEPINLSETLSYTLDNPRNDEEIEMVRNIIEPIIHKHIEDSKDSGFANLSLSTHFALEHLKKTMPDIKNNK